MSFKPFFVHFNRPVRSTDNSKLRHSPRGFTAYVSAGNTPRQVNIQVAFCSALDEFKKQTGRSQALLTEAVAFNPRSLPDIMAKCEETCTNQDTDEQHYYYLLKYII